MPVLHDKESLEKFLKEHNISLTNAVERGKFYQEYFDWDSITKDYLEGKESIRSICRKLNLSYDTVRANLIRKIGNLRPFKHEGRYYFKEEYFKPEVNEYGAYLLGWLYSDGTITNNKIEIILNRKDEKHLEYLASLFTNKKVIKRNNTVSFSFYNKNLCKYLMEEYNLLINKSHYNFTIPAEKFPKHTIPYLLLGLLEGDGSISKHHLSVHLLLTENSWNSLSCATYRDIDYSKISILKLNDYGLLRIDFSGISYFSFLSYIYLNTPKVKPLERKFNNFILQLQRSMSGRTSPYKKQAVNTWDSLTHRV